MTWPNDASKEHLDTTQDDPKQARGELVGLIDKFNQLRNHVSSFMRTLLSRTTPAAARIDLAALHDNVSATDRFLGRRSAGAGPVEELTGAQATARLNVVTTSNKGLAPVLSGDADTFLDGTGSYSAPPEPAPSGPTLAAAQATTSGSSIVFDSLPSGLNQVDVIFHQVRINDGGQTDSLVLELGHSGGDTTMVTIVPGNEFVEESTEYSGTVIFRRLTGTNIWTVLQNVAHESGGDAGSADIGGTLSRVELVASGAQFNKGQVSIQYQ